MTHEGGDKIEEVRARADLVEIVGAHVRLKRAGRNFVGLCPFHNEKTPSFSVNPERGFFHCFGCGAGGSAFDFVMRIEGLNFGEALRSLARRYGVELPERGAGGGVAAGEREELAAANQVAADFFAHVLWNTHDGAMARDYLKSRGVTVETARAFGLGFAPARPANLAAVMAKRGMLEAAVRAGLVRRDGAKPPHDMFRARLIFPIRDVAGRTLAFGGRVLDQRLPKYINSPESPIYSKARTLYGLFEARQAIGRADRAIVVEGYLDAIILWQAGFKETVASLGTALTVEQLRLAARYSKNVIACFDGDAAGRKASLRALEIFLAAGLLGRGAFLPAGHDPDTLVRDRGAPAFAELIDGSELLADYFLREQAAAAGGSMAARAQAAARVAEVLRMAANPFEFDLLARKAAGMLGVSEDLLRREARRASTPARAPGASGRGAAPKPVEPANRADAIAQAELGLLAIAMVYPELRAEIAGAARPAEFRDALLGALLEETTLSEESKASLEVSIMAALDEAQRGRLSAMMVGPMPADAESARRFVAEYASALERGRRLREVEQLRRAAALSGGADAAAAAQELIALRRQAHHGG